MLRRRGGNENRAERRVTTGDALAHKNHVRFDVPVLHRKRFSGAAMPVMTSSAMRRIPFLWQISAMCAA